MIPLGYVRIYSEGVVISWLTGNWKSECRERCLWIVRLGKVRLGKGREGKVREGKGREGKVREGKVREGKGREGKVR